MVPEINSKEYHEAFILFLKGFLTSDRIAKIESVLFNRTTHITVLLEDIYQAHNASAVLRSCDCFGIQEIYTTESIEELSFSTSVTKNVQKWLTLNRFKNYGDSNISRCITDLKEKGYSLVATSPHETSMSLDELPLNKPMALMFGREKTGLSNYSLDHADYKIKIPMVGFSESLNISVSAAICLQHLTSKLKQNYPRSFWKLPTQKEESLKREWYRKAVKSSEALEQDFAKNWNK
jgi:tRNA (guanosine-2'-O-)-methyltransferase